MNSCVQGDKEIRKKKGSGEFVEHGTIGICCFVRKRKGSGEFVGHGTSGICAC